MTKSNRAVADLLRSYATNDRNSDHSPHVRCEIGRCENPASFLYDIGPPRSKSVGRGAMQCTLSAFTEDVS